MTTDRLPKIWVDADACPGACRDILLRAAGRNGVTIVFVANRQLHLPESPHLEMMQVPAGMDVADNEIVKQTHAGDLVITSDIPLAWEVIEKGAKVVTSRGQVYTEQNIRARVTMRDFMATLRASGIDTGGAPPMSQRETHAFANYLDRFIQKAGK